MTGPAAAIDVRGLVVALGGRRVLDGLDLRLEPGDIVGLIGASGGGKTVLLRTILGLIRPLSGRVEVLGEPPASARAIGARSGVLFQQGALFSSLTVRENVEFPMREYLGGSDRSFREVALAKLQMVGLDPLDAEKWPSQLSGGMIKRVALARALALDPTLLVLDEPTSGLDPIAAGAFDRLLRDLHETLGFSVLMATHDLDCLRFVCRRVIALHKGRIVADGPYDELAASSDPWLQAYFHGTRRPDRPER